MEGLCGNYNRFMDDDTEMFDTRNDDKGVLAFVDKWRTKECEMTKENTVLDIYVHISLISLLKT